ncbi:alpha/beta fold hydrolase [Hahella sp. HN01]|uniref:alpha/beta fold hydrolase n=1 Tax=Hahella sp. HN01 TaxID=2847262 RepID=UPI001C1F0AC3|nr:alpha/beta hydrolase [Hahella sp. HN01]MBU6952581.1 alpha/beta hydrolase [Hahella sp. HN01]
MQSLTGYKVGGEGQPILLLHSSMSSKAQWKMLTSQLQENYRTLAVDLWGYGEAPYPAHLAERFRLQDEVDRVLAVLEQEQQDNAPLHVVGHSYGAATALRFATQYPERILSLTIYEPVAFHLLSPEEPAFLEIVDVVKGLERTLAQNDEMSATQQFIDYWSGPGAFKRYPSDIRNALSGQIRKVALDFKALIEEPTRLQDYASFPFNTYLMAGEKSPLSSRRISERMKESLPNLEFKQTPWGHMAPITHVAEINDLILARFLD